MRALAVGQTQHVMCFLPRWYLDWPALEGTAAQGFEHAVPSNSLSAGRQYGDEEYSCAAEPFSAADEAEWCGAICIISTKGQ